MANKTYVKSNTSSDVDLSGYTPSGETIVEYNGTYELSTSTGTDSNISIDVQTPGNDEGISWVTPSGEPNLSVWNNGNITVEIRLTTTTAKLSLRCQAVRVNGGSVVEQTAFTADQAADVTPTTYVITAPAGGWGTSGGAVSSSDRLGIYFVLDAVQPHGTETVAFGVNTTADEVIANIESTAGNRRVFIIS